MATQIAQALDTAFNNDWDYSTCGNIALFERGDSAIQVRFGLSTGQILDAAVANKGEGVRTLIFGHHRGKLASLTEYLTDKDF